MTDAQSSGSSLYRIEHLGENNWIPWKTKVQAILGDKGLEGYIDGTKPIPLRGPDPVPADKLATISRWEAEDRKAKTVIVLLVSDAQMVHLTGTNMAKEMWDQLKLVKESRGQQGIYTWRHKLYRTFASEMKDIPAHIIELKQIQENLHLMGSMVQDLDFHTILMGSLPPSWETFVVTHQSNATMMLHELVAMILEEDHCRKEQESEFTESKIAVKAPMKRKFSERIGNVKKCKVCKKSGHTEGNCWHKTKKCANCGKTGHGHTKENCWCKGRDKEGQGPSSQKRSKKDSVKLVQEVPMEEVEESVNNDVAYMANTKDVDEEATNVADIIETVNVGEGESEKLCWYDWSADSG